MEELDFEGRLAVQLEREGAPCATVDRLQSACGQSSIEYTVAQL